MGQASLRPPRPGAERVELPVSARVKGALTGDRYAMLRPLTRLGSCGAGMRYGRSNKPGGRGTPSQWRPHPPGQSRALGADGTPDPSEAATAALCGPWGTARAGDPSDKQSGHGRSPCESAAFGGIPTASRSNACSPLEWCAVRHRGGRAA